MAGPGLPTNIDSTYPGSATDPSADLHQQHHDLLHRHANRFDLDATPGDGQVLTYEGASNLYKPKTPSAGSGSADFTATPYVVSAASGGTGAYPTRPATTRPVLFRGTIAPSTDGSTAGGGGMVLGLDQYIYWSSASAGTGGAPGAGSGVDLTTDQTIDGVKRFSKPPTSLTSAGALPTLSSRSQITHKGYVDDLAASIAAGSTSGLYEIPLDQLSWVDPATATQAQKLAAANTNSAAQRAALIANPGKRVVMDLTRAWFVKTEINEITDSAVPTGQLYRPVGRFIILKGDKPNRTDASPTGTVPGPVFSVTRRAVGTAFNMPNLRNNVVLGPNRPNSGSVFTAVCSGFDPASGYSRFRAGTNIYFHSQTDTYGYSFRAGYGTKDTTNGGTVNGTGVYKASVFPVAGLMLTVGSYSLTALNAAANLSRTITTLERRTVVGQSSGATALIQGGDFGGTTGQLLANSVSKDFTAGENLRDLETGGQTTGAIVGTFGGVSVLMKGTLNTTYGSPLGREMSRGVFGLGIDLGGMVVESDSDGDQFIPEFNRADAVFLAGCSDVDFGGIIIRSGFAAGIVLRTCWNFYGRIDGRFLPNHALEDDANYLTPAGKASEGCYGYLLRLLGACDNGRPDIHAEGCRHAITSNAIRNTMNQDARTGSTSDPNLSTNFWAHGCGGRNIEVAGFARGMHGTAFDQHEGAERWDFNGIVVLDPHSAGKSTTSHDGVTLRGFDSTVRNAYMSGVRIGVNDQSGPLVTDLVYTNTLENSFIMHQLYGWQQSENPYAEGQASFRIRGNTFRGDPAVSSTVYQQAGCLIRRGDVVIDRNTFEGQNYAQIRLTSFEASGQTPTTPVTVGHVVIMRNLFDWSAGQGAQASRLISSEATYGLVDYIDNHAIIKDKPIWWIFNGGGNTAHRYRGLTSSDYSGNGRELAVFAPSGTSGVAGSPTYAVLPGLGDAAGSGGSTGGTQVTVDGSNVATLDISSTPAVQVLSIDSDLAGPAASANIMSNLAAFQTSLPVGTYLLEAELQFAMSATGGGTLRFGIGGTSVTGCSITNASSLQQTSATGMANSNLTSVIAAGGTATTGTTQVGTSPGVLTPVLHSIKAKLTVTATGTYGLVWTLSNGATSTGTLKAGSYVKITKAS